MTKPANTAKPPIQYEDLNPAPNLPVMASHTEGLLQLAIQQQMPVESIRELVAMRNEELERLAKIEFTKAMNAAQSEIVRVAVDKKNKQTNSEYASYAALDRMVRPIYTKNGFSLSFDTGDAPRPEEVRVLCYVGHSAGYSRTYKVDMPADGKGAKGGDVMTKTHATGSGMQYGQRYLLKFIFNMATGADAAEDDGNGAGATVERINEDKYNQLHALLTDAGFENQEAIKAWLNKAAQAVAGVKTIAELPADKFTEAKEKLKAGIAEKQRVSTAKK